MYFRYMWEMPREKWVTVLVNGLEFRFKYHLNREREKDVDCRPLRREEIIFRGEKWTLRRVDGGMIVCDKVCLDVVLTSSLQWWVDLPWLMKLPGKRFMAVKFLLGGYVFRQIEEFRESLSEHLLFFKWS